MSMTQDEANKLKNGDSSYDDLGFDPDVHLHRSRSQSDKRRISKAETETYENVRVDGEEEEGESGLQRVDVLVEPLVVESSNSSSSTSTGNSDHSTVPALVGHNGTSNSDNESSRPPSDIDLLSQSIERMTPLHSSTANHHFERMTMAPMRKQQSTPPPDTFCAHPVHLHSFTRLGNISTLFRSRFSVCSVCNERISIITGYGDVVTCIACQMFAHRKCISNTKSNLEKIPICTVNQALLKERNKFINVGTNSNGTDITGEGNEGEIDRAHSNDQFFTQDDDAPSNENSEHENKSNHPGNNENETEDDDAVVVEQSRASAVQVIMGGEGEGEPIILESASESPNRSTTYTKRHLLGRDRGRRSRRGVHHEYRLSAISASTATDEEEDGFVWSDAGPPAHWALSSPSALAGLSSAAASTSKDEEDDSKVPMEVADGDHAVKSDLSSNVEEENAWKRSFANLSRALQQNIFASRNHDSNNEESIQKDKNKNPNSDDDEHTQETTVIAQSLSSHEETLEQTMEQSKVVMHQVSQSIHNQESTEEDTSNEKISSKDNGSSDCDQEKDDISAVLEEAEPSPPSPTKTRQVIQNIQSARQIVKKTTQTRSSMGIASVAGSIAGATAGLLVAGPAGIYVGSKIGQVVSVAGVLIEGTIGVGVLAAGITGTVFTVKQLKNGENRMLTIGGDNGSECKVVLVRPNVVVDPVWEEITMDARRSAPTDRRGDGFPFFRQDLGMRERQRRAKDIVNSEEDEINMQEKIFLLVASSLNDKSSLPGYVYRQLIGKVKSRVDDRKKRSGNKDGGDLRAIRQDVHGIIKHITATLLEVRPGFGSSPRLTEISATAVETLVFGEVYDYVMNEIKFEIQEKENALQLKLSTLRKEAEASGIDVDTHISQDALQSLNSISSYHSVAEKLRCCVELLEHVSTIGSNANMGADCLLKLVCQHLALAKVTNLNAECIFLEEFARDQQLLQGKEGYALVTMQASLGFLNASQKLLEDVFHDD